MEGLANYYVWTVAEDERGNIWAGTWGGGLYLKTGESFQLAPGFARVTAPLTAICCETNGGMWLGTAQGLMRYDAGQGTLYPQAQAVRTVLKDRTGAVWFGMSGGGLGCRQDGVDRYYGKADGLGSDFIQCLHEDEAGALWIGTFGGGLTRYQAGHFATLRRLQGLGDNVICDIEDDGNGCFWMSSFNGLLRARKAGLNACADGLTNMIHCDTYGISDGMPTLECSGGSQPAGCATPDGRLWFATSRGLVAVRPLDVKHNLLRPPVIIEKMLVDGELVAGAAAPGGRLNIPPGRHRLEFQYTGLSFAAPEKVAFQHRLDGLDADWIAAGTKRSADYDYIPPGDYTFEVIACNNDGVWSDPGASLGFTMLPYFWQTAWFRTLGLAGLLLLAGGGAWYGTRRRMSRKLERVERQRALERERTRIAKDIHDDLGASLTRINLLSQSMRRGMDDGPQTQKNLDQICTTARQLTRALDEIVWAVDPQHDTLDSLASYLGILIHEQTADSGIRCRLDFPLHLPAWPVTAEVRHNLFLAFKEALHNVVKHSRATEVNIAFALQPEGFAVTISDNGRGFDAAATPGGRPPRNGLVNMRQRLREIGGSCAIESRAGQGTQVIFSLPMREQAK
jgi:signal transduction histidine kinase